MVGSTAGPQFSQKVICTQEGVENGEVFNFAGTFATANIDNHYDYKSFKKGLKIDIRSVTPETVEFDLIGVDAPIVNTLRRILLAEVATVAIEKVIINQNTGVVMDEMLAHRLGLIPLAINPDSVPEPNASGETDDPICFTLEKKCTKDTLTVYARDLIWKPAHEAQRKKYEGNEPRPVHPDIIVAKLAKDQEISLECYCQKGVGKEHAKWSPVSTAWYRLLPEIRVNDVTGTEAQMLKERCPKNVFDIEDSVAVVKNSRDCSTCRECLDAIPDGRVKLEKIKNHFLFTIESTGGIPAQDLLPKALARLKEKCRTALDLLRARPA